MTTTGQRDSSIRYSAAALIVTRPVTVPGFEPTTTRSTLPVGAVGERRRRAPTASASAVSSAQGSPSSAIAATVRTS